MQLKLHTDTTGTGPDLFLVHGWALHSGVWSQVLPELAQEYRVTCADLPGHGESRDMPMPATLSRLAEQLVEVAPENAVWLGWSLGGSACLQAALDFSSGLRALVLVSATPRFISSADWPHAVQMEYLQQLATGLEHDCRKTVQKFLALQVRGDMAARVTLRRLRNLALAHGTDYPVNLLTGLMLLRDSDLRAGLAHIRLPTLIMTGECDQLTPPEAGAALAHAIDGAQHLVISKTAHAPFLSTPAKFNAALKLFLRNLPALEMTPAGVHSPISSRAHQL